MSNQQTNKLHYSQRIPFFGVDSNNHNFNPQWQATNRLLEISDQDYIFDPLEIEKIAPKLEKHKSNFIQKNSKAFNQTRYSDSKKNSHQSLSPLSKTQSQWRKVSKRFISGQEVCVMKRQRIVNLSNFLILDQEEKDKVQPVEQEKTNFRVKPPKSLVAFIKKRNLSHLKQQFQQHLEEQQNTGNSKKYPKRMYSPLQRINMSCQLKRNPEQEPISPIKYKNYDLQKVENISPDIRAASPSFRNKRLNTYRNQRANKPQQK